MPKREVQLRHLFGSRAAWPPELLLPAGTGEGKLGDVRISWDHYEKDELKTFVTESGKAVFQASGSGATPRVPLSHMQSANSQRQTAGAPPAGDKAPPHGRPARGERAAADATRVEGEALQRALAAVAAQEEAGNIEPGTAALLRTTLESRAERAAAAERREAEAQGAIHRHEAAAAQAAKEVKEGRDTKAALKRLQKRVRKLLRRSTILNVARFKADAGLRRSLPDFAYFQTVEALEAHIDFIDACIPLHKIVWLDTHGAYREADVAAGEEPPRKRRRRRPPMNPRDAVLCWLVLIKTGLSFRRVAALFGVKRQTVRRVLVTMTAVHKEIFREEFFELNEAALRTIVPPLMKTFAAIEGVDTAVAHIIDAFERVFQKPSDDEAQAACWSNYKHNYTAKFLLDILSNGAFYFISDAYPGSITDPVLTRVSGFLDLLIEGLDVMADKGFLVQEEVERRGCLNWIPPVRRRGQKQGTAEEAQATHHIANRRIYVENGVRRIKEFGWFSQALLSIHLKHMHGDIAYCIAMLCNYGRPLVPHHGPVEQ